MLLPLAPKGGSLKISIHETILNKNPIFVSNNKEFCMVKLRDTIEKNMFYGATPLIFERAKVLRMNLTIAETKLWDCLKNKQMLGLRFKSQHPISRFIADFYCHQIKLVIEVDGKTHLDEIAHEYDEGRTAEFMRFDILVIRFSNNEIINDIDKVLSTIRQTCTKLING